MYNTNEMCGVQRHDLRLGLRARALQLRRVLGRADGAADVRVREGAALAHDLVAGARRGKALPHRRRHRQLHQRRHHFQGILSVRLEYISNLFDEYGFMRDTVKVLATVLYNDANEYANFFNHAHIDFMQNDQQ